MRSRALVACVAFLAAPGVGLCDAAESGAAPPLARVDPITDTYFGTKVVDPYRWMETSGPELAAWAHAQNDYARAALSRLPGRDDLEKHMDRIATTTSVATAAVPVGHLIFFQRRDAGEEIAKLLVRDIRTSADRVLVDPNRTSQAAHHLSVDQFAPSLDGRFVVVGISASGSEDDVLHVVDVRTGRMLPDAIDRARFASPSWLPDGESFFYNRLPPVGPDVKPADRYKNSKVFIHRLGDDPQRDRPVFGPGVRRRPSIDPSHFVSVETLAGTDEALGTDSDGVSLASTYYLAAISKHARAFEWTKIIDQAAGVIAIVNSRRTLYLLSNQGAPRYRVLAMPLARPDLRAARNMLPESAAVLTNEAAGADGLYVAGRDGASSFLEHVGDDGRLTRVPLPFPATIAAPEDSAGDLLADPRTPGVLVGLQTWVSPSAWFTVTGEGSHGLTPLHLAPSSDPSGYRITETGVRARDGVMVPLTIIEQRGTPHDGRQAVLVNGYGAYGFAYTPLVRLIPFIRGWVDAGGVMAIGHLRGGGDLGEAWHLAGQKATKQNTIHDYIDCAKAMVDLGYAAPGNLAGLGTSAGGIAIGGAITQAPSLFRAALIRVGVVDALRFETAENGPANIAEFGTASSRSDFPALLAMDAYQHVVPGTRYPAVLLTAGAADHRVPLWQPAKMAARLQATGEAKGPILLRVDFDGGHGAMSATQSQVDAEYADDFAFLFWQLGVPRYQPARP